MEHRHEIEGEKTDEKVASQLDHYPSLKDETEFDSSINNECDVSFEIIAQWKPVESSAQLDEEIDAQFAGKFELNLANRDMNEIICAQNRPSSGKPEVVGLKRYTKGVNSKTQNNQTDEADTELDHRSKTKHSKTAFAQRSNTKRNNSTDVAMKNKSVDVAPRQHEIGFEIGHASTLTKPYLFHTEDRIFKCDFCDKSFHKRNSLNSHTRTHIEDVFTCKICSKNFGVKSSLKRHSIIHLANKPFKCNLCEKSYSQSKGFEIHMRTHTGERSYECEVCRRMFREENHLKRHLYTHMQDKDLPEHCDICGKGFGAKYLLRRHMLSHNGHSENECNVFD